MRAVVTGASRGIGAAVAKRLAAAGAEVTGLDRNPSVGCNRARTMTVDLADAAAIAEAWQRILAEGPVDILVNNAGIVAATPAEGVTPVEIDQILAVNLRAAMLCGTAVIPGMKRMRRGRIVNVASRAAFGKAERTSYAASKAGLLGVTRTWAIELAAFGITVNAVSPGPIATDLFIAGNPPDAPATAAIVKAIPLGRMGTAEEVADAIAFFVLSAGFVTGQNLNVCGGMTLGTAGI